MSWFGQVEGDTWQMDVNAVVAGIGLGIIRHYKVRVTHRSRLLSLIADITSWAKHEPIRETEFMTKWKNAVGDAFEPVVSLQLLSVRPLSQVFFEDGWIADTNTRARRQGNYLRNTSDVSGATLSYLAASTLPTDPAARFAELFLTRPRWKSDEVVPFLSDIAVNSKERDRLLLKYARTVTTPEGTWYTARVGYHN